MKKVKIVLALLFIGGTTVSCGDFLSETPDNRTQIDTPKKAAQLLAYAYPQETAGYFTELMTDNVVDNEKVGQTTITSEQGFTWSDFTEEGSLTPIAYWQGTYKAIAQANAAIQALDELAPAYVNKPTQDGNSIAQIKAEALLARAYSHFQLVNIWGKHYDPATATADLGVPYVTEVEDVLFKDYKRESVAKVYELIEKDLLEGLANIGGSIHANPSIGKNHFSEASALAFAARFYLYKGDYEKVIKYSESLGNSFEEGKFRDWYGQLASGISYSSNDNLYGQPSQVTNLLVSTVPSLRGRGHASDRFVMTANIANKTLFSDAVNPLGVRWSFPNSNFTNNDQFYVGKFWETFKIIDFTNMTGNAYTTYVLFSNEMLYLDRIEALVMLNRLDEAVSMLGFLTALRTYYTRNPPVDVIKDLILIEDWAEIYPLETIENFVTPFSLSDDQKVLLKVVLETRRREGFEEGYRWFDIRRYQLKIEHDMFDVGVLTLESGDPRYQLQLPQSALDAGLERNPR